MCCIRLRRIWKYKENKCVNLKHTVCGMSYALLVNIHEKWSHTYVISKDTKAQSVIYFKKISQAPTSKRWSPCYSLQIWWHTWIMDATYFFSMDVQATKEKHFFDTCTWVCQLSLEWMRSILESSTQFSLYTQTCQMPGPVSRRRFIEVSEWISWLKPRKLCCASVYVPDLTGVLVLLGKVNPITQ